MDLFLPPISTLVFKKNKNLIWEIGVYFFTLLEPKREREYLNTKLSCLKLLLNHETQGVQYRHIKNYG